jgi:hypothetical protein
MAFDELGQAFSVSIGVETGINPAQKHLLGANSQRSSALIIEERLYDPFFVVVSAQYQELRIFRLLTYSPDINVKLIFEVGRKCPTPERYISGDYSRIEGDFLLLGQPALGKWTPRIEALTRRDSTILFLV